MARPAAASESVLDAVPRFVVVGAQSSGKSSVLSRLSCVTFPQSSERCTRIGILLKLRRGPATPARVELVGEVKCEAICQEFHADERSTAEAIRLAQDKAVELVHAKDSLLKTLEVYVFVQTPERFNVTLVDLPGLLAPASDSDGPATAERIVKK